MLKRSLLLRKRKILWEKNLIILRVRNSKFQGHCFYLNPNILWIFQICISVGLRLIFSFLIMLHFFWYCAIQEERMAHKEFSIWLSKETSDSKIFDGFDDNTANDVPSSVPIIHQTFSLKLKLRCCIINFKTRKFFHQGEDFKRKA